MLEYLSIGSRCRLLPNSLHNGEGSQFEWCRYLEIGCWFPRDVSFMLFLQSYVLLNFEHEIDFSIQGFLPA